MSISKTIFFLILILSLKNFAFSRSNEIFQKSWQYYLKKGLIQYKHEMYDYSLLNLQKALEQNDNLFKAANTLAEIYIINRDKYILTPSKFVENSILVQKVDNLNS